MRGGQKMDKTDFEIMVANFMADHAEEYADDPLITDGLYNNGGLGWICYAHDSKTDYILYNAGGDGNIRIEYVATR